MGNSSSSSSSCPDRITISTDYPNLLNSKKCRILVMGNPGVGKTCFIQYFKGIKRPPYITPLLNYEKENMIFHSFRVHTNILDKTMINLELVEVMGLPDLDFAWDTVDAVITLFTINQDNNTRNINSFYSYINNLSNPRCIPFISCQNQVDLLNKLPDCSLQYCLSQNKCYDYYNISVKEAYNLDNPLLHLFHILNDFQVNEFHCKRKFSSPLKKEIIYQGISSTSFWLGQSSIKILVATTKGKVNLANSFTNYFTKSSRYTSTVLSKSVRD